MNKIGLREFAHNASKLMKEGEFIITRNGRDEYEVTIKKIKALAVVKANDFRDNNYGCGCIKIEGRPLCKTHGRY